jgi:hypothetical protein
MKYFLGILVLIGCGLAYVRTEEPHVWNGYLTAMKVPETNASGALNSTNDATSDSDSNSAPAPAANAQPVIISPDSTNYVNPDHVHQVDQPGTVPTATNTPAMNSPDTNAPAGSTPR